MKKLFARVFASLLLVISAGADAALISVNNASGLPGQSVVLTVHNDGSDMSGGAVFRVSFTDNRLQSPTFAEAGDLMLVANGGDLYLSCGSLTCHPSDIFTLTLTIANSALPGDVPVTFDWYGTDDSFSKREASITGTVTIGSDTANVPEPGTLVLVGLALVMAAGMGRRRRVVRGM